MTLGMVVLLCAVRVSGNSAADEPRMLVPLDVIAVHDGDTLYADIRMPFGDIVLRNQSIRMQGVDCWEVSKRRTTVQVTDAEIRKGLKARDAVRRIVARADSVWVEPTSARDPYGRVAGRVHVYFDGKLIDLAGWLKENGHDRRSGK